MDVQLRRGILEVCVLKALQKQDSYGYQIIKDVSPYVVISESTLYPILKRMESAGCVTERSVEHGGRLRKYYHLTDAGEKRIADFLKEWEEVLRAYDFIRGEEDEQGGVSGGAPGAAGVPARVGDGKAHRVLRREH